MSESICPCPFCGEVENFKVVGGNVLCLTCGARGPTIIIENSKIVGQFHWNKRAEKSGGISESSTINILIQIRDTLTHINDKME